MFPRVGSQILTEPGSPENFHDMEVKNVSRDGLSVTGFQARASNNRVFLIRPYPGECKLCGVNPNHLPMAALIDVESTGSAAPIPGM